MWAVSAWPTLEQYFFSDSRKGKFEHSIHRHYVMLAVNYVTECFGNVKERKLHAPVPQFDRLCVLYDGSESEEDLTAHFRCQMFDRCQITVQ